MVFDLSGFWELRWCSKPGPENMQTRKPEVNTTLKSG